jgi:hypothetical protein
MELNMTKIERMCKSFAKGDALSEKQIIQRFGYASGNSVRGRITELRDDKITINLIRKGNGISKYVLGKHTQTYLKQGYQLVG